MIWWRNYIKSLTTLPDIYGRNYGELWVEMVNSDLKQYHAELLDNNQLEFRSKADYQWFYLKWQ